tara:strand:- start:499 stop:1074 length:576 start_codon:yes stop_codon:yes gene_type:complete
MLAVFNFCLNISIIQAHSTSQQSQNLEIYQDIGGNFTLLSSNNQYVSLEDFQGKVVLMFFGFTACPDTCPLTLSKLKQVMARLDQKKPVQQLFITVDPKRDNPEQLKSFLSTFNLNIIGLTGTEEEILHVAELYGSAYMKNPTINSETSYLMIHTGYVYLIDQQGQVRAIYPQDTEEIRIIEDIRQLLANI